ncbi:MAG: hypothetical protein QOF07_2833, partial [Bradyrhizobium sp.]|nr:hypothetical protein [Bradyrhizobium sp.]
VRVVALCAPNRITRELCASRRIESGDAVSIAPHYVPLVPEARKRLSPFSPRSQSWRAIVAWTGASDAFESEKLPTTRLLPEVSMVNSSGSTSSCADARCETTTPKAQRASTVLRTRPLRSSPALADEREREFCISYGADRVKTIGRLYVPGALLGSAKPPLYRVRK